MLNLKENILLALNGLRANKMRALLTMLGIIIGISSVIAIVTVGDAVSQSVTAVFNDMGANSIQMYVVDKPDENGNTNWSHGYEENDMIQDEWIQQYLDDFSGEVYAYAVSNSVGNVQAINGHNKASGYATGTNADALKIQNVDILAGHFLNEREVSGSKRVTVLSDRFIADLFPGTTPQQALGKEVKLQFSQGLYTFTVVGVYRYEVQGMMAGMVGDTSSTVFVPIGVAREIIKDGSDDPSTVLNGYYSLQIKADTSVSDTKAFAERTQDYFNRRFYRDNKYCQVRAESLDSMIGQMTGMMDTLKLAIAVIAAISLLVGGIGVMNIMLVSVTERTREIGTRKALGAKNSAIRIQFIVESMIICLIGGALGVTLGTILGLTASSLLGARAWPSWVAVTIAVGFSMAIGVFFGYYPANKAAKLDPIEALRYE